MRLSKCFAFSIAMSLVSFATSATGAEPQSPAEIKVLAVGTVTLPPDIATIEFSLRGEASDADGASKAIVAKLRLIKQGFGQFTSGKTEMRTSDLTIRPARAADCDKSDFDDQARLSKGACAILGHVAEMTVTARTTAIDDAGTMVGLASRLGAEKARISGYDIADATTAQQRALAAAVADGRAQAEAIATAAGSKINRLTRIQDNATSFDDANDIVVSAQRSQPPSEVMVVPPIRIDLAPSPIVRTSRLTMTFELTR